MAAFLSPIGNSGQPFQTLQGVILAGGKLNTYLAGTTTPAATYTDSTQITPNSNPVVLNAAGIPPQEIWLTAGTKYKFIIQDASNNTIGTYDNISGINDTGFSSSEWSTTGLSPTFVSATQFTVSGDQTKLFVNQRRIQATISAGIVYGYVMSSSFSASTTTVNVTLDSGNLDAGLTTINVGFLNSNNTSVPHQFSYYLNITDPRFGGVGDGVFDNLTAINAAISALPATGGIIFFPPGVYNCSGAVNLAQKVGVVLMGSGATNGATLRYTNTGSTSFVNFGSSFDCSVWLLTIDHSSASYTGYLVDVSHAVATDSQGFHLFRCTITSKGNNLYTAKGVNFDKANVCTIDACKFLGLLRPIDGQSSAGGSYSNEIRIKDCQFFDNAGFAINYPGQSWSIIGNNFEPKHDGTPGAVFSSSAVTWNTLTFENNWCGDITVGGASYLTLDKGFGLTIKGNLFGGIANTSMLNATGVIKGLMATANSFLNFPNVFVAAVPGNQGWSIRGNDLTGSTTYVSGRANVLPIDTEANSPQDATISTIAVTGQRIYADGMIEKWGTASGIVTGSFQTISFAAAFPNNIFNLSATLETAGSTLNTMNTANKTTSSFQVFINGSGTNSVAWRAIGN